MAIKKLSVDYYNYIKVLYRELTFKNCDFIIESWEDAFIVELLKWYDNKVSTIKDRKKKWGNCSEEKWKEYYEQMVRMLYFAVIRLNIKNYAWLKNLFRYFFEVEDDDPYRDDPEMISAEKLLKVYTYITNKIDKKSYQHSDKHRMFPVHQYTFIGHWDTEQMKDLFDDFCMNVIRYRGSMEFLQHPSMKKEEEELDHDIKLLQEILDRMKKRVEDHMKESSKK